MWKEGKEHSPPYTWSLSFEGKCNNNKEGQVSIVTLCKVFLNKCSCTMQRAGSSFPWPCFRLLSMKSYNKTKKEKMKSNK
jgi:hypothetical protein